MAKVFKFFHHSVTNFWLFAHAQSFKSTISLLFWEAVCTPWLKHLQLNKISVSVHALVPYSRIRSSLHSIQLVKTKNRSWFVKSITIFWKEALACKNLQRVSRVTFMTTKIIKWCRFLNAVIYDLMTAWNTTTHTVKYELRQFPSLSLWPSTSLLLLV